MNRKHLLTLTFFIPAMAHAAVCPPPTPVRPVVDEYQGVKVADPYRWLENAADPEVAAWTQAQDACTRNYLHHLPGREAIQAKLQQWNDFHSPSYRWILYRAGTFFSLKLEPPKNQMILVALNSPDDTRSERVVVDPNVIDPTSSTAIDFFVPSQDGKFVAVSLSRGGSEEGTLHIYEAASGKELPDQIPSVNKATAGGSVTWNRDGSGFYYTRYPRPGDRAKEDADFYQQVYFHKLGTPITSDAYSIGKDFPRIAEVLLETSEDGAYVLATVANGDGGEFAHYVLSPDGKWTQITRFSDHVTQARLGVHQDLYLVSLAGAPRGKVLRLSLDHPGVAELASAKTIIAEGAGVVRSLLPTENRLYVSYLVGGPSEVKITDPDGKALGSLDIPPLSDVSNLVHTVHDELIFNGQSYTQPAAWYAYAGTALRKTALVTQSAVDFSDIDVKREFATSKDGTQIPLTILAKKGTKLDGKRPTLLYAYGGYSISLSPRFSQDTHYWLEHGGVYVVANIRGGGEFGESWHLAGNLTHKQNVFDDFIASAEHLIAAHYTNREKLAIEGGSNGGLLMGAALTQRPELFHAVVSHVGIYDMLRVELDPNGAFNVTEFGTVKDPEQFKALYAYSPYHHVVDSVHYPSTLLLTGANDGRVNPFQSKKMAARLQAANPKAHDTYLRVNFNGGHGMGRSVSQKVEEEADVLAFLFKNLGMKIK